MAPKVEYKCTRCGTEPAANGMLPRELLTVKKVLFVEMGAGGRTLKSRVLDWLCPSCVVGDPDYKLPGWEHQRS